MKNETNVSEMTGEEIVNKLLSNVGFGGYNNFTRGIEVTSADFDRVYDSLKAKNDYGSLAVIALAVMTPMIKNQMEKSKMLDISFSFDDFMHDCFCAFIEKMPLYNPQLIYTSKSGEEVCADGKTLVNFFKYVVYDQARKTFGKDFGKENRVNPFKDWVSFVPSSLVEDGEYYETGTIREEMINQDKMENSCDIEHMIERAEREKGDTIASHFIAHEPYEEKESGKKRGETPLTKESVRNLTFMAKFLGGYSNWDEKLQDHMYDKVTSVERENVFNEAKKAEEDIEYCMS